MCQAFLPLLKKQGRIVNVASVAGHLRPHSKEIQAKFKEASKSLNNLDSMLKEFTVSLDCDFACLWNCAPAEIVLAVSNCSLKGRSGKQDTSPKRTPSQRPF